MSLTHRDAVLPGDVRTFLAEADRRIERFRIEHNIPGFVPSDFAAVYGVLRALVEEDAAPGNLFCEWGSGFGVVTCLAAMLDFEACGIEIEPELVEEARRLADDFDIPAEFYEGSFLPEGSDVTLDCNAFSWLVTEEESRDEARLGPDDFDVIFIYPWPDEEHIMEALFDRHARPGAILLTYHGAEDLRLRRKQSRKPRRKR